MVTIHDVAKEAGVSPMTVSHVLNDHPHVRESTRERVLGVITRLDYRVNVAARNLRTGRTGTIGLAVPEIDRPYYGRLAAEIIAAAEKHDLRVVIEQTGARRENELEALASSRKRLYDGIILSTVGLGSADTELLRVDHPLVILGERIFEGPVDHVAMANVDGARIAVEHLIERGCRRIVMVDNPEHDEIDVSSLRLEGYRRAHRDAGLPIDPDLHVNVSEFTMTGGAEGIRVFIDRRIPFDGVFCITDTVGIGVLRGLADRSVAVPGDVRVAAFDAIIEGEYTIPRLTTIDPDHAFMARTAVERIVHRIAGGTEPAGEYIAAPKLVVRESSA
ncbi:LacI family DNA-binding transcriptional regulator [Rathayibacter sp. VKM Ac-2803]|uniref:LacI family DNA-binding transcriptional regulator n=1 Tax=Rathayibacter sp. VKM Ac-2803 TaxID=2609256 RepID=UPI0013578ABA|nr:LacI family DNA-binding transcriptional regulator [Rathayibacter sp. VKM Ac-2803]MWV48772.1 LacI family DNA-binding transcriptional regulator [Rathayibacter sp. VKM Ac-2803]